MGYSVIRPDDLDWDTRPHEPEEPPRHVARLTEQAGFTQSRANFWRYEPGGSSGRRHKEMLQEETFVVLRGTLTIYLGEPAERHDVGEGGVVHIEPGTPLQITNQADDELLLYAYGAPPETGHAEMLDQVV